MGFVGDQLDGSLYEIGTPLLDAGHQEQKNHAWALMVIVECIVRPQVALAFSDLESPISTTARDPSESALVKAYDQMQMSMPSVQEGSFPAHHIRPLIRGKHAAGPS